MAPIHNLLHRGNWNDAIKRALGVTKSEGGLERFGETLDPIINLWGMPEWAWLRDETLWAHANTQVAVAAEFGFVAVSIPVGSGWLLTIDGVSARAAGTVQLGLNARSVIAATGTQNTNAVNRDARYSSSLIGQKITPVETWSGTDPGGVTGQVSEMVQPTATDFRTFGSPPWIVKPGSALVVQETSVGNIAVSVCLWGRVRKALPGELVV